MVVHSLNIHCVYIVRDDSVKFKSKRFKNVGISMHWVKAVLVFLSLLVVVDGNAPSSQANSCPLRPEGYSQSSISSDEEGNSAILKDMLTCCVSRKKQHFLVKQVPGEGSCLFNSIAVWLSHIVRLSVVSADERASERKGEKRSRQEDDKRFGYFSRDKDRFDKSMHSFAKRLRDLSIGISYRTIIHCDITTIL